MEGTLPYLIVAFVFLIIIAVLFGLVLIQISLFPAPLDVEDPNLVVCNPEQVLDAWIRNTPNKIGCEPWTNNLVVAEGYTLYEKFFQVSGGQSGQTQCCFFSNVPEQRSEVSQPPICIVQNYADFVPQYTLEELNQKPYFQNGNQLNFIIPVCDSDPNCISFIRKTAGSDVGRYAINKYSGLAPPDEVLGISLVLGDQCVGLVSIYFDSILIGTVVNGKVIYNIPVDPKPQILIELENIFLNIPGRAYPIPGQNPVAAGSE